MLLSSAVALALVATLGVPQASAQKGKDKRKQIPIKMVLQCTNLTTGQVGRNITAVAGDEVSITLRVENRSGEAQNAVVHVVGGIPGDMIDETVVEFFELGQQKSETVSGIVPEDQSGVLTVDVTVDLPKTGDTADISGSVAFNTQLKGQAPTSPTFIQRVFAKLMVHALLDLEDDGSSQPETANISEIKALYR
jgi:hypothetical protein